MSSVAASAQAEYPAPQPLGAEIQQKLTAFARGMALPPQDQADLTQLIGDTGLLADWIASEMEDRALDPAPALQRALRHPLVRKRRLLAVRLQQFANEQLRQPPDKQSRVRDDDARRAPRSGPEDHESHPPREVKRHSRAFREHMDQIARVRERVERQRNHIRSLFIRGDMVMAQKCIEDLVDYQQIHCERLHLAKSLCWLASAARRMGHMQIAETLLRRATTHAPDDGWAWKQLGALLRQLHRLDEAEDAAQRGIIFNDSASAHNSQAELWKAQGRLQEALTEYETILQGYPRNQVARVGRAGVLRALGRFDEALCAYDESIRLFPDESVPYAGKAELFKSMGRLPEALCAYDLALSMFPLDQVPRTGRAELLRTMGRFTEALAEFDHVLSQNERNVVARNGRVELLRAMGRTACALQAAEDNVHLFPFDPVSYNVHAELLKSSGRGHEALSAFEDMIERFPRSLLGYTGRVDVLRTMGRYPEALSACYEVIGHFSHSAAGYLSLVMVHRTMGHADDALLASKQALLRFPRDASVRAEHLGLLLCTGHHHDLRDADFPDDPHSHEEWRLFYLRCCYHLGHGDPRVALQLFQRGNAGCPFARDRSLLTLGLCATHLRLGQPELAVRCCEGPGASIEPAHQALRRLLWIHGSAAAGKHREARRELLHLPEPGGRVLLRLKKRLSRCYGLAGEPILSPREHTRLLGFISDDEYAALLP